MHVHDFQQVPKLQSKWLSHLIYWVKRAIAQLEGNRMTLHSLEKFVNDMKLEIQTCLDQETGFAKMPPHRANCQSRIQYLPTIAIPSNNCKCFRRQFEFQLWPIKCELNSLMSQFNEPASLGQNLSRIQSSILLRAGHVISLLTSKTCCSILRVGHVRLKQNWIINQSEQQEPTYWLN